MILSILCSDQHTYSQMGLFSVIVIDIKSNISIMLRICKGNCRWMWTVEHIRVVVLNLVRAYLRDLRIILGS